MSLWKLAYLGLALIVITYNMSDIKRFSYRQTKRHINKQLSVYTRRALINTLKQPCKITKEERIVSCSISEYRLVYETIRKKLMFSSIFFTLCRWCRFVHVRLGLNRNKNHLLRSVGSVFIW